MKENELYENEDFLDLLELYGDCIGVDETDLIEILEGGVE